MQVYSYYIQGVEIGKKIPSPFRRDRNPSWSITEKEGSVIWRDWGTDEGGNMVTLIQKLYNLTYDKALTQIAVDMGLIDADGHDMKKQVIPAISDRVPATRKSSLIQVTARSWNSKDDEYWNRYMIARSELIAEDVHPVQELYIQRVKYPIQPDERVYVYRYPDDRMKIYMPDRVKGEKWKSNIPCAYVEGLERLNGDPRVLITKSKKDRLVLSRIVPYPVLNVQNEGSSCFHEEFRKRLEGREVIVSYDADPSGVANCKKICDTFGYKYVNTPRYLLEHGVKDWSDWVALTGSMEEAKKFMQEKNVL